MQASLVSKIWFKGIGGAMYAFMISFAAYAGYYALSEDTPCAPGPLAVVLLTKAGMSLFIILVQLFVWYEGSKTEMHRCLKLSLQVQQLVFFASMGVSLYGFYIAIDAAGFMGFLKFLVGFGAEDVDCGSQCVDAMAYFLISWFVFPCVILAIAPRGFRLQTFLTSAHLMAW